MSDASATREQISSRVSFVSIVASALLFLMPWLELRCSGTEIATQAGWQAALGQASASERFENMREGRDSPSGMRVSKEDKEDLGIAAGALAGGLLLLAALAFSIHALSGQAASARKAVLFATIALVAIGGQAAWGFPMESRIDESLHELKSAQENDDNPFTRSMAVAIAIECRYTPWFYAELGCLALPVLLTFILGASMRANEREPPDTTFQGDALFDERES